VAAWPYQCSFGSSDFDKSFENCYASCSFRLAKYLSDCFTKGIFLHFVVFLSFLVLVSKNFKNCPSER
jgi:hypothetical protein